MTRRVTFGQLQHCSELEDLADVDLAPRSAWWQSVLRGARPSGVELRELRIVDAFCGPGGLGLGAALAAEAVGFGPRFQAILDSDPGAIAVHRANSGARYAVGDGISSLVDFHVSGAGGNARFAYEPEILDPTLARLAPIDLFVAGPPCEGHSNLNNHTRRADPRNKLYVAAVALAVGLRSRSVLIENVPTVQNDRNGVVWEAVQLLRAAGYRVSTRVLKADELGAAQRRQRFFLLAWRDGSEESTDPLAAAAEALAAPAEPLSWAIGDLLDRPGESIFDTPAVSTDVNRQRIDYLFDNDLYDLPDQERPDCHKNGTTYRAVYGRMHWDRPAQTITTGFNTPGQGRYVHPLRRRVITPREAARIQGFPDWFGFDPPDFSPARKHYAKWIGDAVHPILGYAAALAALAAVAGVVGIPNEAAAAA